MKNKLIIGVAVIAVIAGAFFVLNKSGVPGQSGIYAEEIPHNIPRYSTEFKALENRIEQELPKEEQGLVFNYILWGDQRGNQIEEGITVGEAIELQREHIKQTGKMLIDY